MLKNKILDPRKLFTLPSGTQKQGGPYRMIMVALWARRYVEETFASPRPLRVTAIPSTVARNSVFYRPSFWQSAILIRCIDRISIETRKYVNTVLTGRGNEDRQSAWAARCRGNNG